MSLVEGASENHVPAILHILIRECGFHFARGSRSAGARDTLTDYCRRG